jgi:hypothetical protein
MMNKAANVEYKELRFALFVLSVTAVATLMPNILRLCFTIPLDYNEGWNAYHALRAIQGENIYDPQGKLFLNNYPPLSFYIVGSVGKLIQDNIYAGRFVALLSFFLIGITIGLAVFSISKNRLIGAYSGLFFITTMGAGYGNYIGINDPQMLAHAVMTAALLVFLNNWDQRRRLFIVAMLACTAGLIKHNLIALPIALTIFIYIKDIKAVKKWLMYCILIMCICLLIIQFSYGSIFFESIISEREYMVSRIWQHLYGLLGILQIPMVCMIILVALNWTNDHIFLISIYAFISLITGLFFFGGANVDVNVIFDLVIAVSIGTGVVLMRMPHILLESKRNSAFLRVIPMALSLGIFLVVPGQPVTRPDQLWSALKQQEMDTLEDIAILSARPGPALCEDLSLCYWAQKEFEYDRFNTTQAILAGRRDESEVLGKLNSGYFTSIHVYPFDNSACTGFTSRFIQSVKSRYVPSRITANGTIFISKEKN